MDFLSIISYILEGIIYVVSGYVLLCLTQLFVPIREKQIFKAIAYIGLTSIGATPVMISDTMNISLIFLGFIFLMLICYNGDVLKKLSVVIILYPIIVSADIIGNCIAHYFISDLCQLAIIGLLYWMIKNKINNCMLYLDRKTLLLTDSICIASFIAVITVPIVSLYSEWQQVLIMACACMITNAGILLLISYLTESTKVHLENKYYKLQYEYYKTLENKQIEVRKIHHDMNHHLQLLSTYLANNSHTEAQEYLDKICKVSNSINLKLFCQNSLINALVNSKYITMIENEIDCDFNIAIDKIMGIDDIDLCALFSNTIDNAIEASLQINYPANRHISVKARVEKGYFSYCVTNSKENNILEDHGVLETSKPDSKFHGFGLLSIRDIVNKYRGSIDIDYTDNQFSLVVIIKAQ